MSCMVVRHPAAPSLIGVIILQKKKDSKREMKNLSPVNCKKMGELNKKSKKRREDEEDNEFESWFYMFDNSDGASSEYDNFSLYNEHPTHTLWMNYAYVRLTYAYVTADLYHSDTLRLTYAYFTAELCIHYGWVIIKLWLSYAYVMAELWLLYSLGFEVQI